MRYQAVYIDMVFLVNFMMDLLLLFLLQTVLRKRGRWPRLFLGAAAGGLWACLAAVTVLPWQMEILGSVTAAAAMVSLAFRERRLKSVLLMSGLLLALSFYLSGLAYLVYYHSSAGYLMQSYGMPSYLLFPIIGAGSATLLKGVRCFWRYQSVQRQLCQVLLLLNGKQVSLTGLIDTGNQLYDPYGRRPVQIAEAESLSGFLPEDAAYLYVPYRSVGKADGLLPCFVADEMILFAGDRRTGGQMLSVARPLIGISPQRLGSQGRYQMILHADVLAGAFGGILEKSK